MSPHFGIMDEDQLGDEKAALTRAKLHIRSAKRRLRSGKNAHGIVTYWDALIYAMRWYYYSHQHKLAEHDRMELYEPETLYELLKRSDLMSHPFDFYRWERVADEAIDHKMSEFDGEEMIGEYTKIFNYMGITPFDESELPAEMEGLY